MPVQFSWDALPPDGPISNQNKIMRHPAEVALAPAP
jgi:hypothetical protein